LRSDGDDLHLKAALLELANEFEKEAASDHTKTTTHKDAESLVQRYGKGGADAGLKDWRPRPHRCSSATCRWRRT
jgi:hypothetical protein